MSRQRDRFYQSAKSGPNTIPELLHYRVDPGKTGVPFSKNLSSKEQTPKISSKVVAQSQLISVPDSTPTIPVQSHSLPSDINKKRSSDMSRVSYPPSHVAKKKARTDTKRRASASDELHNEKSIRKGGSLEEHPDGTFQTSTNIDKVVHGTPQASKGSVTDDGDRKHSLQEVILTSPDLIANIKNHRSHSIGYSPLERRTDDNQQMLVKRNVAQSHF